MLQCEMDAHLGYEKHDVAGNNMGNSRNDSFPKTVQTEHGESTIQIPRDRNGEYVNRNEQCNIFGNEEWFFVTFGDRLTSV